MLVPARSSCQLSCLGWLLATLLHFLSTPAAAQPPAGVANMAYTTVDENTLYVHGGSNTVALVEIGQFFALDLTVPSWDAANPPWKPVAVTGDSPPCLASISGHTMSVSQDHNTITVWAMSSSTCNKTISNFGLVTKTWTPIPPPAALSCCKFGVPAAMDPSTGLVYLPGGYNMTLMMVYNMATKFATAAPMPGPSPQNPTMVAPMLLGNYPTVWSTIRETLLLFGSNQGPGSYFFEFVPPSGPWRDVISTGTVPPNLDSGCLVSAYNGTKIIYFGGNGLSSDSVGSIYILDVLKMSWTQGPNVDPSQNRSSMACAVSGDNFIAWGGERWNPTLIKSPVGNAPLIYNHFSGKWTTQYIRGNHYFNPSATTTTAPSNSTPTQGKNDTVVDPGNKVPESGGNVAAIGGGAAGGVVVVIIIGFIVIRKRLQSRKSLNRTSMPKVSIDSLKPDRPPPHMENERDGPLPSMENERDGPATDQYPETVLKKGPQAYYPPVVSANHPQNHNFASHRSPTVSHQSPTVSHQSPTVSHQSPTVSRQSPIAPHQIIATEISNESYAPYYPPPPSVLQDRPSYPTGAGNPQDNIQQLQQEISIRQSHLAAARTNPQYIPSHGAPQATQEATTLRAPQGGDDGPVYGFENRNGPQGGIDIPAPVIENSNEELQAQINALQAELHRRQGYA
ncbi:hypothetical protein BGZ88_009833 [Linnemannia elongata]|nr:hypothetical protein BGZ88_009833 [Linnemannia elongata]